MQFFIFILATLFLFETQVKAQISIIEIKSSKYFEMASIHAGINWAFDNSADDYYQIVIRLPLISRFHIAMGTGYRNAAPYTIAGSLAIETDVIRREKQRIKFDIRHSYLYRKAHFLFDNSVHKTCLGIGAETILLGRMGFGIEYAPFGFYYGTRHDHSPKDTPSLWGAREIRTNIFFSL